MSGFRDLIRASTALEESLKEYSDEQIISATSHLEPEDIVEKKMDYLKMLLAKSCFVKAHNNQVAPEVSMAVVTECHARPKLATTTDTAFTNRVLGGFLAMSCAARAVFLAPNGSLDDEQAEFKRRCGPLLHQLADTERHLTVVSEKAAELETEREEARTEWDELLGRLHLTAARERDGKTGGNDEDKLPPGREKLLSVVRKLELMRTLMGRLAVSMPYDWVADDKNILNVLSLTRQHNTLENFTEQ